MATNTSTITTFVEIIHRGIQFKVRLTPYELSLAENDEEFRKQIGEKYFDLYRRGFLTGTPVGQQQLAVPDEVMEDEERLHDSLGDTDNYDEEPENVESGSDTITNERFIWSRSAVLLLLAELTKRKKNLMQPHKKIILFGAIANVLRENGYEVTWSVYERKWRGLQTTYKKNKNEGKSGAGSVTWEFFEKVDEIISGDPAFHPPATTAVGSETIEHNNGTHPRDIREKPKKGREWLDEMFSKTNRNLDNMQQTLDGIKNIQMQRNQILDRVATALEKLVEQ